MRTETKNLIRMIKLAPLFVILFACILTTALMYQEQEKEFRNEELFTQTQYIENEKDRIYHIANDVHNYVKSEKKRSQKNLKKDLKLRIDNVHKMATNIYNKNKNTLTKKQIIKLIKNAIETIRFQEGKGYFSIHTIQGINILHPTNHKFEDTSVLNRKDVKGNYPVQEAIKIAKTKGEGFFQWYYSKPNDKSKEFKKIGIVKKFEPYNLIITTAIYIDDFEKNLQKDILSIISNFKYKHNGYIVVIEHNGKVLLHKSKKVLNHNVIEEKLFSHVSDFFKRVVANKGNKNGEFITIKPSVTFEKDTKERKVIYARVFNDWKWIILTSFKLSDANEDIEKRKIFSQEKYYNYKKDIILYGVLATIILLMISYFIANLIEKKFLIYRKREEEQIQEQLKVKDKLIETNKKIRNISENIPGVIYTFQLFSDGRSCFPFASDDIYNVFGVTAKEVQVDATELFKVLHPEDLEHVNQTIQTSFEELTIWEDEYRIIHPEKGIIWLKGMAKPEKQSDESVLWYGYVYEITELKHKDEMLINQSRQAAMGEMIGMIAHQWRQPISVIAMDANNMMLDIELESFNIKEAEEYAKDITKQTQHLSKTIDDFRNFFKPDKVIAKVNIRDVINQTISIVKDSLKNHNIKVSSSYKTEIEVDAYPRELMQVFVNIINNAKDALKSRNIQNSIINIEVYEQEKYIITKISDNAGGIDADILSKVFDPYFSTKDEKTGTGLGLYMSKMIIEKHLNGLIDVSNTNEGACFTVRLLK